MANEKPPGCDQAAGLSGAGWTVSCLPPLVRVRVRV